MTRWLITLSAGVLLAGAVFFAVLPHRRGVPCDPLPLVAVGADGTLSVDGSQVAEEDILSALDAAYGSDASCRVMVRAEQGASYGDIMRVMTALQNGGRYRVAIVAYE